MSYKHTTFIGLGGTFDHLHDGHKKFLKFAVEIGHPLKIGITTPAMHKGKPWTKQIQPWSIRARHVSRYLQSLGVRFDISRLSDGIGPTLEDESIFGIAVTEETVEGAKYINNLRDKMNLRQLETFVCPLALAADGQPIHSSRIRQGEISQSGEVYQNIFKTDLKLNQDQRKLFTDKQGELVDIFIKEDWTAKVAVVGDASVTTFRNEGWLFDLAVYDGLVQRENSSDTQHLEPDQTCPNQAGTITTQMVTTLSSMLKNKQTYLKIEGEEDLATVALVLLMPLYSKIFYGQPNEGMVELEVTPQLKEKFYTALQPN